MKCSQCGMTAEQYACDLCREACCANCVKKMEVESGDLLVCVACARWHNSLKNPSSIPPAPMAVPTQQYREIPISRLQPENTLGQGSFGSLLKAKWGTKSVAYKLAQSEKDLASTKQEATLLRQLTHPHIIKVHATVEHTGYVMDLMPKTLNDEISQRKSNIDISRFLIQMNHALKFLHARGVIHRDLKPANILLDENKNVKIADFGIACQLPRGKKQVCTNQRTGTRSYMPPEALNRNLLGLYSVGPFTDLYALGFIVYEILTKRKPQQALGAKSYDELIARTTAGARPPIPTFNVIIPGLEKVVIQPAIARIIQTCWAQKPEDRMQAYQLIDQLEATQPADPLCAHCSTLARAPMSALELECPELADLVYKPQISPTTAAGIPLAISSAASAASNSFSSSAFDVNPAFIAAQAQAGPAASNSFSSSAFDVDPAFIAAQSQAGAPAQILEQMPQAVPVAKTPSGILQASPGIPVVMAPAPKASTPQATTLSPAAYHPVYTIAAGAAGVAYNVAAGAVGVAGRFFGHFNPWGAKATVQTPNAPIMSPGLPVGMSQPPLNPKPLADL